MSEAFAAAGMVLAKQAARPTTAINAPRAIGAPASSADFFTMCGSAAETQSTSTSGTYADVINVSGAGVLLFCAMHGNATGTSEPEITITIDGTAALNAAAGVYGQMSCPVGAISNVDTTNLRACIALDQVFFTTSCRVQLRRKSGTGTVSCALKYRMT